jgi:putative endonuclease
MNQITEKRKLGNLGEDLACRFLVKHGFQIIVRNYLKKCGEIDIITKKENKIHFIEVKSVSCEINPSVSPACAGRPETLNNNDFRPEDNVHTWKLKRLYKTIELYLIEKNVSSETDWQIDVITVYIDKKQLISKVFILENVIS